ncbi:MAG: GFA family protein [Sphingorhabdus sp.]
MALQGGCQCGAVRYEVNGTPQHVALCHCSDCRKSSGAPMVAWAAFAETEFTLVQGDLTTFNSSGSAMRSFCSTCGTGIAYRNQEYLPGIVDIQSATLDDPDALPAGAHIQVAERIGWMAEAHSLPEFQRYPGM